MKKDQFDIVREQFAKLATVTMDAKRPGYTNQAEDVLANFVRVGERTGLSPEMVAYVYASKHWDSIGSFIAGNKADPEGIKMRLVDMRNYIDLMNAILEELKPMTSFSSFDEGKEFGAAGRHLEAPKEYYGDLRYTAAEKREMDRKADYERIASERQENLEAVAGLGPPTFPTVAEVISLEDLTPSRFDEVSTVTEGVKDRRL